MGTKGICSICLRESILSEDHIPPKSCGNHFDTYYKRFSVDYLVEHNKESRKILPLHSQNGIKFITICSKCNSELGAKYDPELTKFYKACLHQLMGSTNEHEFDMHKVCKAVTGHLLAASRPSQMQEDDDMRRFFRSSCEQSEAVCQFCRKYSLLCLGYPYEESQVVLRNFVPWTIGAGLKRISGFVSILYFYPLAFIFCQKAPTEKDHDLLDCFPLSNFSNLTVSFDDWFDNDGSRLGPTWPAVTDANHFFVATAASEESVFKIKR